MENKYLVQIQIEKIQNFLFEFLENSENFQTLKSAKYYSEEIEKMTDISHFKNAKIANNEGTQLTFSKFFENIPKEKCHLIINISGKVLVEITSESFKTLQENFYKEYTNYFQNNIALSFISQEIKNNNSFEAYKKLQKKNQSPNKMNETFKLVIKNQFISHVNSKNNKQLQAFQLLENYKENNNIAVIKGDLNNLGDFFKNLNSIESLKKYSEDFKEINNKFIENFKKTFDQCAKIVYLGGDDIFIIGKMCKIPKLIKYIEENLLNKINEKVKTKKITIGLGILTVNHKAIFRYYLPRVEQLMEEAKKKSKEKEKNYLSVNGQLLAFSEFEDQFVNQFSNKEINQESKSILYNVLNILNDFKTSRKSVLEAVYIITKNKSKSIFLKNLANELIKIAEDETIKITEHIEPIILKIRNYITFQDFIKSEKPSKDLKLAKFNIKQYEIYENFEKLDVEQKNNGITSKLMHLLDSQKAPKGFWFRLYELLSTKNTNELSIFLLNYQINNNHIFYYTNKEDRAKDPMREKIDEKIGINFFIEETLINKKEECQNFCIKMICNINISKMEEK